MPGSPDDVTAIAATLRAAGCVFAEDEARLLISAARTPDELAAMVDRRAAGLPVEQVVGWAEFCGLRIAVEPGVFVPRRRTEFLASQAITLARAAVSARAAGLVGTAATQPRRAVEPAGAAQRRLAAGPAGAAELRLIVVDLCCGSGALGAALAAALPEAEIHAADIDPRAVRCARRNLAAAGGHVYEGDLYGALPNTLPGRVGILAANVPYVPTGEIGLLPPEARLHEPPVAYDGGADGLRILRLVAAAAPRWLAPGGSLLTETTESQAPQVLAALAGSGLEPSLARSAELDAIVVTGTRPGARGGPETRGVSGS